MSAQGSAAGLPTAIAPREGAPASRRARSVLATTSAIHFVHDGFSDVIYLLLPIWATQFGLTYGQVGCACGSSGGGVRGWGRDGLGTGARGRGARARRALMSTTRYAL